MNTILFYFLSAVLIPLLIFLWALTGHLLWKLPEGLRKMMSALADEDLEALIALIIFILLVGAGFGAYHGTLAGEWLLRVMGAHP